MILRTECRQDLAFLKTLYSDGAGFSVFRQSDSERSMTRNKQNKIQNLALLRERGMYEIICPYMAGDSHEEKFEECEYS